MISFIQGKLVEKTPSTVVILTGGIGYQIQVPVSLQLPPIDTQVKLYTAHVIRETSQTLFGFVSQNERDLFDEMIGISGIGPKVAINLIGHLPSPQLEHAIFNADIGKITRVPGIGKKTAERLMLDIRHKLEKRKTEFNPLTEEKPDVTQDATLALIRLGYSQERAQKAVKKACSDDIHHLSELIARALACI